MVNALEAGTIVAVLAAVVGWYMVLRRQSFAGHTLSVMAFPGAAGAALAGLPTALGYYLACGAAALVMRGARGSSGVGSPGRGYGAETATIATVQTVGLGRRLPVPVAEQRRARRHRDAAVRHVPRRQPRAGPGAAAGRDRRALALVALATRPLLLETIDPEAARARGPAGGRARPRLPARARARRRRHEPDHRRAARVRAAGGAAGRRPAADDAPRARPGAQRRVRARRRVARPRDRILLDLPGRLLRHELRLRPLRARSLARDSRPTRLAPATAS